MNRYVNRFRRFGLLTVGHIAGYSVAYLALRWIVNKPAFPPIQDILVAVKQLPPILNEHFLPTITRWLLVLVFGLLTAIPLGTISGFFPRIHSVIRFDIDFWRSIPATAMLLFVMAAFGDNALSRVFPAFYITFWTVLYYVARHVRLLKTTRIAHLKDLGATSFFILRNCVLYELLPVIIIATRQAVSLSFLILVSVELIVGPDSNRGIGGALYAWQDRADYAPIILTLIMLGVCGYIVNLLLVVLHTVSIRWESTEHI